MRCSTLSLALLLAFFASANAQPVFNASNIPVAGTTALTHEIGVPEEIDVVGGANHVWDFSSLDMTALSSVEVSFHNPATTPYATDFPTATIAEKTGDVYSYYKLAGGRYSHLGDLSPELTVGVLTDPMDAAIIPWTFNASFTDALAGPRRIVSDGTTINFDRVGSTEGTYIGYGTLVLPGDLSIQNVMLIKLIMVFTDSTDFEAGPGMKFPMLITTSQTIYIWFQEGRQGSLMTYTDGSTTTKLIGPIPFEETYPFSSLLLADGLGTVDPPTGAPHLISPPDGFLSAHPTVNFQWDYNWADMGGSGSGDYSRIQVSTNPLFDEPMEIVVDETLQQTFNSSHDFASGIYYWRVGGVTLPGEVDGSKGDGSDNPLSEDKIEVHWSSVWSFAVCAGTPAPVGLVSPRDSTVYFENNNNIVLTWSDTSALSEFYVYYLEIAVDPSFEELYYYMFYHQRNEADLSLVPFGTDTTFYWRVRNQGACGQSEWSEVRRFIKVKESSVAWSNVPTVNSFPQPVGDLVSIPIVGYGNESAVAFDAMGRVHNLSIVTHGNDMIVVNTSTIGPGVYTVVVRGSNSILAITRIVVAR